MKSVTNLSKPLEVGLKLTIILRYLATGEMYTRGVGSNFFFGGRGTRLHRRDPTPTILVNFTVLLHVGDIQIQTVQLKYFKVSLPKEIFVMTSF